MNTQGDAQETPEMVPLPNTQVPTQPVDAADHVSETAPAATPATATTSVAATATAATAEPTEKRFAPVGPGTVMQIIVAVLWFGMVAAISFIEAPLKFQAPGITIPLGLGIGRLVFAALNSVEAVLAILLIVFSMWPKMSRVVGQRLNILLGMAGILLVKIALVRPPLNARTDLVLEGADPGQSPWHYIYIACDVALLALLAIFTWQTARMLRRALIDPSKHHKHQKHQRHPKRAA